MNQKRIEVHIQCKWISNLKFISITEINKQNTSILYSSPENVINLMVGAAIAVMDTQNAYLYTALVTLRWVIILFPNIPLHNPLLEYLFKSKRNLQASTLIEEK